MIFDTCALSPVTLEQRSNNWLLVIPTKLREESRAGVQAQAETQAPEEQCLWTKSCILVPEDTT